VRNDVTDQLGKDVGDLVDPEGRCSNLPNNIDVAVERHGDDTLSPDDEQEREIADASIDVVGGVVPEARAVHDRHDGRDDGNDSRDR